MYYRIGWLLKQPGTINKSCIVQFGSVLALNPVKQSSPSPLAADNYSTRHERFVSNSSTWCVQCVQCVLYTACRVVIAGIKPAPNFKMINVRGIYRDDKNVITVKKEEEKDYIIPVVCNLTMFRCGHRPMDVFVLFKQQ